MATNKPSAVAISASAIPGATVAREADFIAPIALNVFKIPQTVPNKPTKGEAFAQVAKIEMEWLSFAVSLLTPWWSERLTLSAIVLLLTWLSLPLLNSFTPYWATENKGEDVSRPSF